jgi:Bacterial Ig-like domain (group 2)
MQKTELDLNRGQRNALPEKFGMKRNLRLIGAFAVLAILALAVSCKGFFQNPTISSVTIDPPNPTVSIGQTTPLTAIGTDNFGDPPTTLKGGTSCTGDIVCWSSATPSVATINTGGLVTGVSAGTSTITAASGTASATTTVTVTLANVTNITLGPNGISNFSLTENTSASGNECLTAMATAGGQTVDVTTSVTWQTGTPNVVTVYNGVEPMCILAGSTPNTTTVYATYVSGDTTLTSNSITVTVTE